MGDEGRTTRTIARDVVGHLGHQGRRDELRQAEQAERVAIGCGLHYGGDGDGAEGAGTVLDQHRLAERRQRLAEDARHGVRRRSRRAGHD